MWLYVFSINDFDNSIFNESGNLIAVKLKKLIYINLQTLRIIHYTHEIQYSAVLQILIYIFVL